MHAKQTENRADWFAHDRFGMFIHWGLYSNPAGIWKGDKITHQYSEWLQASERIPREEYRELAEAFCPSEFVADDWIREAKTAGMKYLVITTKHHDGFALWPTSASKYNIQDATPFGRDPMKELAEACQRHGIKLGFYYSHWLDWDGTGGDVYDRHLNDEYTHPDDAAFEVYWQEKCLVQVRELLEAYDPWLLWFDSWGNLPDPYVTPKRQNELIALIRKHSDKCLINSRIQMQNPSDEVDFLSMGDNQFPDTGFDKPWETSGTLNDSWAYHALDFDWKSTRQLLKNLIGNASIGGNYQLNVGPTGAGLFQPAAIRRLREIGAWLKVNGESIYGTQGSPLGSMPWGRVTARTLEGNQVRLYLHLWDFTPQTALLLEGLEGRPLSAKVLETGQPVTFSTTDSGICLCLPAELAGLELPVIALDLEPGASPAPLK